MSVVLTLVPLGATLHQLGAAVMLVAFFAPHGQELLRELNQADQEHVGPADAQTRARAIVIGPISQEDLAAVGLRGTADELRANVGYIRRAVEKPKPQPKCDALDFLECK
mgnify:CR=1 FL=1